MTLLIIMDACSVQLQFCVPPLVNLVKCELAVDGIGGQSATSSLVS
jgi:hypothetical protein